MADNKDKKKSSGARDSSGGPDKTRPDNSGTDRSGAGRSGPTRAEQAKKEQAKKPQAATADQRDADDFEDDLAENSEHLFDEAEFEAEGWSIPRDSESIARALRSLEGWLPGILKRSDSGAGAAGAASSSQGSAGPDDDGDDDDDSSASSSGAEGFRARLGERKLPREAINFLLGQVDNTKREFLRIASKEVRLFLESVDLGGEIAKILTTLSFEVRMEVRFIPNDQALKPSARGRVRFKKNTAAQPKTEEE